MGYEITSYIDSIGIEILENGYSIGWQYVDHDATVRNISYSFTWDEWPENYPIDVQNLQAAYAADHGIRNSAGTRHDIDVHNNVWDATMPLAEFEKRGGLNILDPDGYDKWIRKQHVEGQFAQHGSLHPTRGIRMAAHIEVTRKQVSGGLVSLGDWITQAGGEYPQNSIGITDDVLHFTLTIRVPDFLRVVNATAHTDYAPLVGLITLLNGNRAAGDPITGAGANPFGAPTHRFLVSDHARVEVFQIVPLQTFRGLPDNTHLSWLSIQFAVTNAPDAMTVSQQISLIHNWVQRVITAPADTRVYEDNHVGGRDGMLDGLQINLSDRAKLDAINGPPRVWVPVGPAHVPVNLGGHRILDHDQLTPVLESGNETHRVIPPITEQPMVHEIHHYGATRGVLRLPKPADVCASSGNVHPLAVDNQFEAYEVQTPAGDNIVTLSRGERANLALVWDAEGNQRIVGDVPRRRLLTTRGSGGVLNDRGYWDYSSTQWARPIKMPAPLYANTDAFEVPGMDTNVGAVNWTAANFRTGRDSFTMKKSGELIIYQNVRFAVVGSGTMPHGVTTVLAIKRGDTILEHALNVYDEITGAGQLYELTWLWIGQILKDDVVQLVFVMPKSSTLNIGAATVRQAYRAVLLDQHVVHEVAA